ncbi:YggT family protein [Halanaerobacter jeridensis]|uniref:YggT family protein n=1 Tax=Halanaerobacter jeridensis TaxID=706427 RepID=A0A938XRI3_9FIRM|nr:YggT family protein [Halanaerobacter jeridensis]
MVELIIKLLHIGYDIYSFMILARIIASWVQPPKDNEFMRRFLRFVYEATEPVLAPLRQLIPIPAIDLSPIVALLLLQFIVNGLSDILRRLAY